MEGFSTLGVSSAAFLVIDVKWGRLVVVALRGMYGMQTANVHVPRAKRILS